MIELSETFSFEAAHRIETTRPELGKIHGHSHGVIVTIQGELQSKEGWLIEQSEFRRRVEYFLNKLDHSYLNEILENTTAEGIATHLLGVLRLTDWPKGIEVVSVEVSKTTTRARATR